MTHSAYPILDLTFIAAEDLTEKQYMVVEVDSVEGQVQLHVTEDTFPLGILRNKPDSGETAIVRVIGVTEAAIGGDALAYGDPVGDELSTDVPTGYVATASSGETVYGFCLNASGSTSGDYATIMCNFLAPTIYTILS
jgi:hypothetical protein